MTLKIKTYYRCLLIFTFAFSIPLNANEVERPLNNVGELSIEIDGELEESAWLNAFEFVQFKVTQPLSLETPPNDTEVKITSDKAGLYIAFINHQTKNESVSSHSLKDAEISTDFNQVIIDFDAQGVRAYGFKVSRTGAMQDSVWTDENRESIDWDATWQAAVEIEEDEDIWISEIFIPWSIAIMTSGEQDSRTVKLYFSRQHQGKSLTFSYPAISPSQKSFISHFTPLELTFQPGSALDFFPYIAVNRDLEYSQTETRAGVDIFWKPTSSQQLNMTLNPDFGQVESDELVVNFSAIETFNSEKRPFFRENHDLFDLQGPETLRLVHTPRIGSVASTDSDSETAADIAGAARYTLISDWFDFGFLSVFEDDNKNYLGSDYLASRLLFKDDELRLGLLHTQTDKPNINKKSNVTTLDFQLEPIDEISISGQYIESQVEQFSILASNSIKTKDAGWWITTEWEPSDAFSHELTWLDYGKNLDLNDFGFVSRVNREQLDYQGSYQWTDLNFGLIGESLRDVEWAWEFQSKNNEQQHDLPDTWELDFELTFDSTRALELQYEQREAGIDDLITRGFNPVYFPRARKASIAFHSAKNSVFTFELEYASGKDYLEGNLQEIEFTPIFRLGESSDLSLELEWVKNDSWVIWDEENVLEEFERDELSLALNFNSVIGDKHEIRVKLEGVILEAVAKREFEADSLGQLVLSNEAPDSFSLSEFAAQVRYRYALSDRSELFIVYSRGGEYERERLGFDRSSILNKAINQDEVENLILKLRLHF